MILIRVVSCPLCKQNDFRAAKAQVFNALLKVGNKQYYVITAVCNFCGHVFSDPRLGDSETAEYYSGYYRLNLDASEFSTTLLGWYSPHL